MKSKMNVLVFCAALGVLVFANNANAALTFGVSFDTGVNADVAVGDGVGYRYDEDNVNASLLANRGITTAAAQFGAASLDCITTGKFLAYRTAGNIDLNSKGTLEFFMRLPDLAATATHYAVNVGQTNGLEFRVSQAAAWTSPHLVTLWGGAYVGGTTGYVLPPDVFNHVAITWDFSGGSGAGVAKVFINGTVVATKTAMTFATLTKDTMWIGQHYSTGGAGPYYMDDLAIYNDVIYTGNFTPRTVSAVPEPATLGILLAGSVLLGLRRKR